ncbi:hypothetical protein BHC57_03390 [Snodgrassella alvi]|uniref:Uncharacterized protein n=1 Tax=Snodgrassella alvi TaxID=1196083 RepID=A0A855G320_9NEIS|nr:hypothetical protein BHC57_03390 [Snodgrassella alvi]
MDNKIGQCFSKYSQVRKPLFRQWGFSQLWLIFQCFIYSDYNDNINIIYTKFKFLFTYVKTQALKKILRPCPH